MSEITDMKKINDDLFLDPEYQSQLSQLELDTLGGIFNFQGGENLIKANLATWRHRIRFQLPDGQYAYLKRYVAAPKSIQIKSWLQHGKKALLSEYDRGPSSELNQVDVSVPQVIAYGGQWKNFFESKSFIITLEIPNSCSLEKKLPACFYLDQHLSQKSRKDFIIKTGDFIRRFHETGYRHRDLYLAHLFLSNNEILFLIDLHRTFKPSLLCKRYQLKDIAQLYYSCPGDLISRTDRLRFFYAYMLKNRLTKADKAWIRKVNSKAMRIARHDRKHGRTVPFEKCRTGTEEVRS